MIVGSHCGGYRLGWRWRRRL